MEIDSGKLNHLTYYNNKYVEPNECFNKIILRLGFTFYQLTTWHAVIKNIEEGNRNIAFHIDMIKDSGVSISEFIDTITNITKFMKDTKLVIGVIILDSTELKDVRELQKTCVNGILLDVNCYPLEEIVIGVEELFAQHPYWPKHIIEKLPGNVKKKPKPSDREIYLTDRQQDIFHLVARRGLSNKKIAQILNITESTVKVHVSAILKAYRVRNRTQLALSATPQGLQP